MVDNKGRHFKALLQDVVTDYQNPPLTGDVTVANKAWRIWTSTPLYCLQCQLNFSLWCATAGCGVSFEGHLQAKDPLLASLYWFHVYYTTRRLLEELHITLPGDNSIPGIRATRAYKRLCSEFSISSDIDWRQKLDHGYQGLGSWSTNMTPSHEYRHVHQAQGIFLFWTQSGITGITATFQWPG